MNEFTIFFDIQFLKVHFIDLNRPFELLAYEDFDITQPIREVA